MKIKRVVFGAFLAALSLALLADDWNAKLFTSVYLEDFSGVRTALANGANVNGYNRNGDTPLTMACFQKDDKNAAICELLISSGANVSAEGRWGFTALMAAAFTGQENICKLLITKGAMVNKKDPKGRTALHFAAQLGFKDICDLLLLKGVDAKARDDFGETASDYASQQGHMQIAQKLRSDAGISSRSDASEDALFKAIGAGDKTSVEKMLSSNSALLRSRTKGSPTGLTPLHLAALRGKTAILELLIQKGADINAKVEGTEFKNWTTLHFIAYYFTDKQMDPRTKDVSSREDPQKALMLLKEKGADMNVDDGKGYLPLDVARVRGSSMVAITLQVFGGKSSGKSKAKGKNQATAIEDWLRDD